MKHVIVEEWIAKDGRRFRSGEACASYEKELEAVHAALRGLPDNKIPHGKYLQHDRKVLLEAKRRLWDLVLAKYGDEYPAWKDWPADSVHPHSIVGRVLEGDDPISRAWARLARFNFDLGREYDQPYFAMHPKEAILVTEKLKLEDEL